MQTANVVERKDVKQLIRRRKHDRQTAIDHGPGGDNRPWKSNITESVIVLRYAIIKSGNKTAGSPDTQNCKVK